MSFKNVQVGSDIFKIPIQGGSAPWGQDLTDFFVAIAAALETVQGPEDILLTEATLANNQASVANIPGLSFSAGVVQSIDVDFLITRIYDSGTTTVAESGKVLGNYNGTVFNISIESAGNSGVDLSITNVGQFQYTSTNLANHVSTTIKYRARTVDS